MCFADSLKKKPLKNSGEIKKELTDTVVLYPFF